MKLLKIIDFSEIKEKEIFALVRDFTYQVNKCSMFPKYKTIKRVEIFIKKKRYGHWDNSIFLIDDWDEDFDSDNPSWDGGSPGDSFHLSDNDNIYKLHKMSQQLWLKP